MKYSLPVRVSVILFLISLSIACQQTNTVSKHDTNNSTSEIEILKDRFTADLLDTEINEEELQKLVKTIREDGAWPGINYEDTSRTAFEHSRHLENMVELGRAYKKRDSVFYQDSTVKKTIVTALDYWLEHDFICENWWWNQIGTPERIGNLLLIMDEELTEKQKTKAAPIVGRANLDAWGARPGGDLIKIAGIMGKYGIFAEDQNILEEALEAIVGEIGFAAERGDSSDRRGLQTDFSFHHRHDRVTSTLTYGHGFAGYFINWADKVKGTAFSFPDSSVELITDFYLDGISKTMAFGKYPDPGALNRGITRRNALNPRSPELPQKLLRLSSYRQDKLEAIVQIRKGKRKPDLKSSKFFWHTEYFSHQRPHYFTSVRMFSSRNHSMEVPYNGEGLKNHHLGDGYNFITRTGEEYIDIFPVWDWQKIPGTTVVQKPSLPDPEEIQQPGLTNFVGGITDGTYGAAVFDFKSPIDPLSARKSWFFFDDEFVSLGSDVNSDSEYPVATTLNQSKLTGDVISGNTDGETIHSRGRHNLDDVAWVHHNKTAYLFPEPAEIRLENRQRTGFWHQINGQSWAKEREEVHKDVFSLWIDHGVTPEQDRYEYIVVPGIEVSEVEKYRKKSSVDVLSNTPKLQAVRHTGLNLIQIVFYEPGEINLSGDLILTSDKPAMVMIKTSDSEIEKLIISDPSRKQSVISLTLTALLVGEGSNWKTEWDEGKGFTSIQFELPQGEFAGQSVIAEPVLKANR